MVDPKLLAYIKKELSRGVPKDKLKVILIQHGWPAQDVDAALKEVMPEEPKQVIKGVVEGSEKKKPKTTQQKCPKCGALYGADDDFCPVCGETLSVKRGKKEPVAEQPSTQTENPSTSTESKKFPLKYLIIGLAILVLIGSAFGLYFFLHKEEPAISTDQQAKLLALSFCNEYCKESKCELFKNPSFSAEGLRDKSCSDLDVECSKCA